MALQRVDAEHARRAEVHRRQRRRLDPLAAKRADRYGRDDDGADVLSPRHAGEPHGLAAGQPELSGKLAADHRALRAGIDDELKRPCPGDLDRNRHTRPVMIEAELLLQRRGGERIVGGLRQGRRRHGGLLRHRIGEQRNTGQSKPAAHGGRKRPIRSFVNGVGCGYTETILSRSTLRTIDLEVSSRGLHVQHKK